MRRLASYVEKYGPEAGPRLFRTLQSQAAHAGVAARRKRKIEAILARRSAPLPLFDVTVADLAVAAGPAA